MCGIVGYIGKKQAAPVILEGLERLEYRGYDSTGMAIASGDGALEVRKAAGRLNVLYNLTRGGAAIPGHSGIGHTRWATHGVPNDVNAHPHTNTDGTIAVVHNGIIENYAALKEKLTKRGYSFRSETDTEVLAQMLDYYYDGDPLQAVSKVLHRVEGSYALGILFADHPGEIYAARRSCPLIVGRDSDGSFMASDVTALLRYTRDVIYLDDQEIGRLTADSITFYDLDEGEIEKEPVTIDWDADAAEKGGYEHFMLKEMLEQPQVVRDTLSPHLKDGRIVLDELGISDEELRGISKVFITACGSAYHTGMTAKYVIEGLARVPVEVDLASEFRYRDPILSEGTLVVVISQSGETLDTLEAMREAKARGARTLAIVNVVGSSIAREADYCIYTVAGPEIAVATTKAYSAQLIVLYLFAMHLARVRGKLTDERLLELTEALSKLPAQIEMVLNNREEIQRIANRFLAARDVFFMGRGIDYAISLEGSLKLKEISYIHSEAYAAGELKHGTISLIEKGTMVAAIATQEELFGKIQSNMEQVRSRGAVVFAVTVAGNTEIEEVSDFRIYIPETDSYFTDSLAVIPLQLLAYYIAVGRGCDVDKPRNLAKSVTVE